MKVSAVIISYNEEDNIGACLDSVSWCDEVIVVDSLSTDATPEICKQRGAIFHQRAWNGINEQRQFALSLADNDWVLAVDADERVSDSLREEVRSVLANGTAPFVGYSLPRHTHYLGRWINHGGWFPDLKLRLFDRSKARYAGEDPHDRAVVDGPVGTLTGELEHYTYRNLADQLKTINRFSATRAGKMRDAGVRFSLAKLMWKPPVKFLETYFWKQGFRDALPGFIIAICTAFYIFLTWAKLWELNRESVAPK